MRFLLSALAALVRPGDDVLLPDPVYDAYAAPIALWGGRPVGVRATVRHGRFLFDRATLEESRTPRSRVLLLNTPWNPVGTVLTRAELGEITAFAVERDLVVLSDEIYEALVYDGRRHLSPAATRLCQRPDPHHDQDRRARDAHHVIGDPRGQQQRGQPERRRDPPQQHPGLVAEHRRQPRAPAGPDRLPQDDGGARTRHHRHEHRSPAEDQ